MNIRRLTFPVLLLSALVLCFGACSVTPAGPTQHETRSVDKDASEKLRTAVRMGAGSLKLSGGSSNWMQGNFTYNVASWKPNVVYSSSGGRGDLTVEQPSSSESHAGNSTNEWDVKLNNDTATDLTVRMGAGEATLNLGALDLRSLDVEMGAGQLRLDLRGDPKHSYDVRARGGAGEATIHLPKAAGLYVTAKGGLGDINVTGLRKDGDHWVNDAYDKAKVQVKLDFQGGVGSISIIAE